ncbi:MAG: transglutaminase family protein [Actinomycetota bacterium]|nr:MAG: transglutaminase family protein [Actinomycetota bacterium]
MDNSEEFGQYLSPTWFIDCDNPDVISYAKEAVEGCSTDEERAVKLFLAVRDGVRYDPYSITNVPIDYKASDVLRRRVAYCIPKAVLLTALSRAAGIPARLGFADVRNHLASEKLLTQLGSGLFIFHGFTEFWLHGTWVKATPAFNIEMCERFGVHPLEFDGYHDTLFHEFSVDGQRHMEYVGARGSFADLPLDEIISSFDKMYGKGYYVRPEEREKDELFDVPEVSA